MGGNDTSQLSPGPCSHGRPPTSAKRDGLRPHIGKPAPPASAQGRGPHSCPVAGTRRPLWTFPSELRTSPSLRPFGSGLRPPRGQTAGPLPGQDKQAKARRLCLGLSGGRARGLAASVSWRLEPVWTERLCEGPGLPLPPLPLSC